MAVVNKFWQKFKPWQWWQQHLTVRLSACFLILSLISVGITGSATFYQAQDSLQNSAFDQLKIVKTLKVNEINRWFEDQQRILLSIAQFPAVQDSSKVLLDREINLDDRASTRTLLLEALTSLDSKQQIFTKISILDPSDRIIFSTQSKQEGTYESAAELTYFEAVQPGKPTTPIFYQSTSDQLMTTLATPIRGSKGERIGILLAQLNLERLGQIVQTQTNSEQAVDAYLVSDVDGVNVLVSNALHQKTIGQTVTSEGINTAMRGLKSRGLYQNYAQIPVIGVYQNLSDLGLALIVEQQQDIAELPARQLARKIMIVGLALSFVIAVVLYYLVHRIVRPVLAIAHTATQVALGELHHRAPVLTRDEVGILARKFNYMVEQLQLAREQSERHSYSLERQTQALQVALQEVTSTQAQLVQSEKMSSLGQMVAGVAHEINNPVNFIHGNLKYLECYSQDLVKVVKAYQESVPDVAPGVQEVLDKVELDFLIEDISKILSSMSVGTNRIREIVLSLRNFSRLDESESKAVNIHEGIDSTLLILQHRLKATEKRPEIPILRQYGQLPSVECYPSQLNQVLMNLFTNAIDALEESNQDLSFQSIVAQPNIISIHTQMLPSNWIRIEIADNGAGIPEDIRSRLFDPFFTTKPVGKGTGLGLSISYQIITTKHHGKIHCDSRLGQGTKFVIEIPISQQSSASVTTQA